MLGAIWKPANTPTGQSIQQQLGAKLAPFRLRKRLDNNRLVSTACQTLRREIVLM